MKEQFVKTKLCPYLPRGCQNGESCSYAHSEEELRPLPNLQNTKLCESVTKGNMCQDRTCTYAHSRDDLRATQDLVAYKTALCLWYPKRKCLNGDKCRFAHGAGELKPRPEDGPGPGHSVSQPSTPRNRYTPNSVVRNSSFSLTAPAFRLDDRPSRQHTPHGVRNDHGRHRGFALDSEEDSGSATPDGFGLLQTRGRDQKGRRHTATSVATAGHGYSDGFAGQSGAHGGDMQSFEENAENQQHVRRWVEVALGLGRGVPRVADSASSPDGRRRQEVEDPYTREEVQGSDARATRPRGRSQPQQSMQNVDGGAENEIPPRGMVSRAYPRNWNTNSRSFTPPMSRDDRRENHRKSVGAEVDSRHYPPESEEFEPSRSGAHHRCDAADISGGQHGLGRAAPSPISSPSSGRAVPRLEIPSATFLADHSFCRPAKALPRETPNVLRGEKQMANEAALDSAPAGNMPNYFGRESQYAASETGFARLSNSSRRTSPVSASPQEGRVSPMADVGRSRSTTSTLEGAAAMLHTHQQTVDYRLPHPPAAHHSHRDTVVGDSLGSVSAPVSPRHRYSRRVDPVSQWEAASTLTTTSPSNLRNVNYSGGGRSSSVKAANGQVSRFSNGGSAAKSCPSTPPNAAMPLSAVHLHPSQVPISWLPPPAFPHFHTSAPGIPPPHLFFRPAIIDNRATMPPPTQPQSNFYYHLAPVNPEDSRYQHAATANSDSNVFAAPPHYLPPFRLPAADEQDGAPYRSSSPSDAEYEDDADTNSLQDGWKLEGTASSSFNGDDVEMPAAADEPTDDNEEKDVLPERTSVSCKESPESAAADEKSDPEVDSAVVRSLNRERGAYYDGRVVAASSPPLEWESQSSDQTYSNIPTASETTLGSYPSEDTMVPPPQLSLTSLQPSYPVVQSNPMMMPSSCPSTPCVFLAQTPVPPGFVPHSHALPPSAAQRSQWPAVAPPAASPYPLDAQASASTAYSGLPGGLLPPLHPYLHGPGLFSAVDPVQQSTVFWPPQMVPHQGTRSAEENRPHTAPSTPRRSPESFPHGRHGWYGAHNIPEPPMLTPFYLTPSMGGPPGAPSPVAMNSHHSYPNFHSLVSDQDGTSSGPAHHRPQHSTQQYGHEYSDSPAMMSRSRSEIGAARGGPPGSSGAGSASRSPSPSQRGMQLRVVNQYAEPNTVSPPPGMAWYPVMSQRPHLTPMYPDHMPIQLPPHDRRYGRQGGPAGAAQVEPDRSLQSQRKSSRHVPRHESDATLVAGKGGDNHPAKTSPAEQHRRIRRDSSAEVSQQVPKHGNGNDQVMIASDKGSQQQQQQQQRQWPDSSVARGRQERDESRGREGSGYNEGEVCDNVSVTSGSCPKTPAFGELERSRAESHARRMMDAEDDAAQQSSLPVLPVSCMETEADRSKEGRSKEDEVKSDRVMEIVDGAEVVCEKKEKNKSQKDSAGWDVSKTSVKLSSSFSVATEAAATRVLRPAASLPQMDVSSSFIGFSLKSTRGHQTFEDHLYLSSTQQLSHTGTPFVAGSAVPFSTTQPAKQWNDAVSFAAEAATPHPIMAQLSQRTTAVVLDGNEAADDVESASTASVENTNNRSAPSAVLTASFAKCATTGSDSFDEASPATRASSAGSPTGTFDSCGELHERSSHDGRETDHSDDATSNASGDKWRRVGSSQSGLLHDLLAVPEAALIAAQPSKYED